MIAKTAEPLTDRYPRLLRWSQAEALAIEMSITANCFRDMVRTGNIRGMIPPGGKRKFYYRDDIITLLS